MARIALMLVLLLGALIRDNTAFVLSQWTGMEAPGIYRILGGLWVAVLCAIVASFLLAAQKDGVIRRLSLAGCAIGAVDGLMSAGCRLGLPPPPYPRNTTQCDYWAGWSIGSFVLFLEVIAVVVIIVLWATDRHAA